MIIAMTATMTRTSATRAPVLSVLAILAAAVLAGCTTTGTAVPKETAGSSGSVGVSTTSVVGGNKLHDLDPCALLSAAEVQQLGASRGEREDVTAARRCNWTVSGSHTFDIAIFENKSAKDAASAKGRQSEVTIGHHRAQRVEEGEGNPGLCDITFAITATSSVSAGSSAGTKTAKACDVATQVANLIEPKLQ